MPTLPERPRISPTGREIHRRLDSGHPRRQLCGRSCRCQGHGLAADRCREWSCITDTGSETPREVRESAFAHLHRFRLLWIRWETGDDVPEAFFASERAHSSAGGACTAGPGPRPGNRGAGALAPPPHRPRLHRPHPHPHRHRTHPHTHPHPTPAPTQDVPAQDRDRPPPLHLGMGMNELNAATGIAQSGNGRRGRSTPPRPVQGSPGLGPRSWVEAARNLQGKGRDGVTSCVWTTTSNQLASDPPDMWWAPSSRGS